MKTSKASLVRCCRWWLQIKLVPIYLQISVALGGLLILHAQGYVGNADGGALISFFAGYFPAYIRRRMSFRSEETDKSHNVTPPTFATFLLYLVLSKQDRKAVPGDLEAEFMADIVPQFGLRRARFWYWSQVLRSIAPLLTRQLAKLFTLSWLVNRVRSWLP